MSQSLDARRVLIPVAPRMGAADRLAGPAASPITAKAAAVRRYRLGRMPLYTRPDPATDRFAQLRRSYD